MSSLPLERMSGKEILTKTLNIHKKRLGELLNSISNEYRLTIVSVLVDRSVDFRELQNLTGLSKTALSHHLTVLTGTGIVLNPSRGQYMLSGDGLNLLAAIGDTYLGTIWKEEEESRRRAELFSNAYKRRKKEMEVRIVDLEPMKVASFRAISETPEHDSARKLAEWAQKKGYLNDLGLHPIFGFNNPDPSKDKKEYGYEFWIKVDEGFEEEGVEVKDVSGAKYAVTTCESLSIIGERWKQLVDWIKDNGYDCGEAQWLEKTHDFSASDEELVLDLYLAIN